MNKQPELTAMTRKKLMDTYFDLMAEGGKPTVGAVTKRAGYNRCTFYRYFTDTEQLLEQVEAEICAAFQTALEKQSSFGLSGEMIRSFAGIYKQYDPYLAVLLGRNGDIRFINKMKEIMYPMAEQMFAADSDSETIVQLKAEFALSAVLAGITKWYEMKQPISIDQMGMLLKDFLQKGVLQQHSM